MVTDGAKNNLGWGLIGASDIAATYMIPAIRADPRSAIVGVSSRSAEWAASYAGDHQIPASHGSHQELLADDDVDVVYISSVNSLHHHQALDAAAAGKHVLCEKPLALSNEDANEMVAAFAERGLVLGVNHHLRNASANRAARDAIRNGEIGRPLSARALQAAYLAERLQTWRLQDPAAGAGVTLDITVHDVDLLRFVLGDDVVEVSALSANQGLAANGIEDAVVGCLRFGSGLLATVHDAFNVADARTSLEVYGTEGAVLVTDAMADDPIATAELRKDGESRPLAMEPQEDLYERGVAAFTAAVLDGSAPVATGEDGAASLAVALAMLEAAAPAQSTARVAFAGRDHLGEGPSWNVADQELSWVDINGGLLRRWKPAGGEEVATELGAPVSFAVARERGGWAIGREDRVALIDSDGRETTLMQIDDPPADSRFNDAKSDAAGRLWAGTMSTVRAPGVGSLYRVDPDGASLEVVSSTTISNGLGWSPDNGLFYFIDSTTQQIDVFDFDLASGSIDNRRRWVSIDASDGLPDGLAVDAEGGIWLCLFGGGCVRHYDSDANLDAEVQLPVSNPTCPTFGGPQLNRLYVTTAQHRLTPEQLAKEDLAGAIFEIDAGVRGIAAHRFAG